MNYSIHIDTISIKLIPSKISVLWLGKVLLLGNCGQKVDLESARPSRGFDATLPYLAFMKFFRKA